MNKKKLLLIILLVFGYSILHAQQKVIQLYKGPAPGSENWNWDEAVNDSNMFRTKVVYNVTHPSLTVFTPDASVNSGTAVIICPGGGFHTLSINSEGNDVAAWLVRKGVTCFVLKYRLVHSLTNDPVKEMMSMMGNKDAQRRDSAAIPLAIADGKTAIAYVRSHATEYHIDANKIGVIGFSAGGTVAASAAYNYTSETKPDFVAPVYAYMPAQLQAEILPDAPPMFIAAASDDQLGLAAHSIDIYTKWVAAKKSAELHMYSKGGHGFGMRVQHLPSDTWIDRFGDWLKANGYIK
ncbi:MAG TPA: alpha/beta hydrolase [Puia sp.]|nr:alpha/beta hydrolase [Puia sp.]